MNEGDSVAQLPFAERYGPWAVVTGAASGLGEECATQLAGRGLHLLLLDIQAQPLRMLADRLSASAGVQVRSLAVDLAEPDFLQAVIVAAEGLEVGLVANVAGLSHVGRFLDIPLDGMLRAVAINCQAPLTLARHFLPAMVARGRGGVIFFSSASAFQGTPLVTNYAATKAYNLVLGEGLWGELRGTGVDALAFAPGATDTPGFRAATPQPGRVSGMSVMAPGPTIAEALEALGKTPSQIAGRSNRLAAWLTSRVMSRRQAIETFGSSMGRLYPHVPGPSGKLPS